MTDERGTSWWNALNEADRAYWLQQAKTAIPALAWAEYRRQELLALSDGAWGFVCERCMAEWTDTTDESACPQCGWPNYAALRPLPATARDRFDSSADRQVQSQHGS